MSDYRHNTDRKEATVVDACPNGCEAYELETEGENESVDSLIETVTDLFDECGDCGEPIGVVRSEKPTEVLE